MNTKDSKLQIPGEVLLTSLLRNFLIHSEIVMFGDSPNGASCLGDSKLCPVVVSEVNQDIA